MAPGALAPRSGSHTYADLRRRVQETLLTGQRQIEQAKVNTYWETGRLIDEHLLHHLVRAEQGAEVMRRLAQDLDLHESVLYRCLRFARAFPSFAARQNLTWAHYRVLSFVDDPELRKNLERQAVRNEWTSRQLEERIRPNPPPDAPPPATVQPLSPKRGVVGLFRLVAQGDVLAVDLGFTSYLDLTPEQANGLKEDHFVRLNSKPIVLKAEAAKPSDLYTYRAEVLRVVDGDTLWMKIYLRPRHWLKEKLRLRGIDCPEMDTPEGQAAKKFVEALVNRALSVTITTTKPDKWDRYLSDVFLETNSNEELFLNNLLLENGHAVRKDRFTLNDWERLG